MGVNLHSMLEKARVMWVGGIEALRNNPRLEIQHLEDELKSDKLTLSERQEIDRRLCELKATHFDDIG
jgi:hypothetical protein